MLNPYSHPCDDNDMKLSCLLNDRVQGEGEEEVGDQRKGDADVSVSIFQSGVLDARDRKKYGRNCGVPLHRKGREG